MGVSIVKASEEHQNQRFIADGLVDVSEGVGEVLELGAVVAD
jgi:glycerol-3-phosphate responsive antiterminator